MPLKTSWGRINSCVSGKVLTHHRQKFIGFATWCYNKNVAFWVIAFGINKNPNDVELEIMDAET